MMSNEKYNNAKKGFSSYFLSFDTGARLEIMERYEALDGSRRTGDGYYERVVFDPDKNRIEITV